MNSELMHTSDEMARAVHASEIDALVMGGGDSLELFALRGSDRAYRTLVEEMAQGALTLSPEGVIVYANLYMAEVLAQPLASIIGAPLAAWFAPSGQQALKTLLIDSQRDRQTLETTLVTASFYHLPVYLSVCSLEIDGLPGALCMTVTDLTKQKRAETAIQAREALQQVVEQQHRTEEQLRASLATLHLHDNALSSISQAVVISDAGGRVSYVNKAFEEITGYGEHEMLGNTCRLLQGPDTDAATLEKLNASLRFKESFRCEILNYRKNGSKFWNELSISPVLDDQGVLTQFVGVQRDITERYMAEQELSLAAKVFEQSSEAFVITDAMRRVVRVNHAFTQITGFRVADIVGQPFSFFNSDRHDSELAAEKWAAVDDSGNWVGEVWKRHSDGMSYPHRLSLRKLTDSQGLTTHYIASLIDITQNKADQERIRRLAHYDVLTGLPNRALLQERAQYVLKMAQRSRLPMSLIFFDVDHFKNINDSLGHRVGDMLLVQLAVRIQSVLRDQDCLSRFGGDEFIIILPDTDAEGATRVAQKILDLTQSSFALDGQELNVSISMGVAVYPMDGMDFETLASGADAAMYRAKQAGRNTVRFHTPEMQVETLRAICLEKALRKALLLNQLSLHYQPQMDLQSRQVIGAEALLRWHHPDFGLVSPAEFIPIAERVGMILSIGEWVINTVARQLVKWISSGMKPIIVAVNLSAVQFRQPDLIDMVQRALVSADLPAHLFELELTESMAVDDPVGAMEVIHKLHQLGVKMSIDDFGTGYSSLSYLKRFRVDKLKIDQSFVRNLTQDLNDQAIVRAIIAMADSLGLKTVAEGVETEAQLSHLAGSGCKEIQGYWLSRPLAADAFRAFMQLQSRPLNLTNHTTIDV